jgi:hypothetical protein
LVFILQTLTISKVTKRASPTLFSAKEVYAHVKQIPRKANLRPQTNECETTLHQTTRHHALNSFISTDFIIDIPALADEQGECHAVQLALELGGTPGFFEDTIWGVTEEPAELG